MQKLKDTNIYQMRNGGVVRIPMVFYEDNRMDENKAIEIHRETLPDGRDALIIIPKQFPILKHWKISQKEIKEIQER